MAESPEKTAMTLVMRRLQATADDAVAQAETDGRLGYFFELLSDLAGVAGKHDSGPLLFTFSGVHREK